MDRFDELFELAVAKAGNDATVEFWASLVKLKNLMRHFYEIGFLDGSDQA